MPVFSKPLKPPPRRSLTIALIVLLILRTRLLTLPKDAAVSLSGMLKGKGKGKEKQRFTKEDLAAVLQQVYLDDPKGGDGKTLLVPYRDQVVKVCIALLLVFVEVADTI
jgi:ATP-binding cassette subfamily D (ALD) long-chain fatty acid import protein